MLKENNLYDKIAYVSYCLGILLMCIYLTNKYMFNFFHDTDIENIIFFISIGLIMIYHKIKEKPISVAYREYLSNKDKNK